MNERLLGTNIHKKTRTKNETLQGKQITNHNQQANWDKETVFKWKLRPEKQNVGCWLLIGLWLLIGYLCSLPPKFQILFFFLKSLLFGLNCLHFFIIQWETFLHWPHKSSLKFSLHVTITPFTSPFTTFLHFLLSYSLFQQDSDEYYIFIETLTKTTTSRYLEIYKTFTL